MQIWLRRGSLSAMGLSHEAFDRNMASFTGAARRLEVAQEDAGRAFTAFRDFAHAPSKLRATQASVVGQFPDREVTAVFELHTFSSLNKAFLPQYKAAMDAADRAVVFLTLMWWRTNGCPSLTQGLSRAASEGKIWRS